MTAEEERRALMTQLLGMTRQQPAPYPYLTDPCMVMTKYVENTGYGRLKIGGLKRKRQAHWIMHLLWTGEDVPIVRHRCDVRACIQPSHLLAGDPKSNMRDKLDRGRQGVIKRKLTLDQVKEIKRRLSEGQSAFSMRNDYPVSLTMIQYIAQGRRWKNVLP